jgi:hypothetical protein
MSDNLKPDLVSLFSDTHALVNSPLTLKELQAVAVKGIKNAMHTVRMFGQGTHSRTDKSDPRRVLADGRTMHCTKGIGKSERGGYVKHSRRSNRS